MEKFVILAINPGSTSTKVAVFENEKNIWTESISHTADELLPFEKIKDQYEFRLALINQLLEQKGFEKKTLFAVVGRGGPLKPLESGTYFVDDDLCSDLRRGVQAEHASNLGGLLAKGIADEFSLPSYIVDPVSVDEMQDLARLTGWPDVQRKSLFHALNLRAVALRAAKDLKRNYKEVNFIMVHLGGGISLAALQNGKMIDVSNPNDTGPFSPERAGALPTHALVEVCFGKDADYKTIRKRLVGKAGLVAHLGLNDGREIEKRIQAGDEQAKKVYMAMAYNIAKEIGAMSTVLKGNIEAIILTGGLAYSAMLTSWIKERTEFLAKVLLYPGEDEMQALAEGALRVLRQEEKAKKY